MIIVILMYVSIMSIPPKTTGHSEAPSLPPVVFQAGDILGVSQKLGEKRSSKRILELGPRAFLVDDRGFPWPWGHGGTLMSLDGCCWRGKSHRSKWMMTGGSPMVGKPHIYGEKNRETMVALPSLMVGDIIDLTDFTDLRRGLTYNN